MQFSNLKQNKIKIILIIAVLIIWGVISYRMVIYFNGDDENNIETIELNDTASMHNANPKSLDDTSLVAYVKLDRDPFKYFKEKPKYVSPKPKVNRFIPIIVEKPQEMNFRISGVIINDSSKVIIFEDVDKSKTVFLREGESYNSITIKNITKTKVEIEENKIARVIELAR